jgi:hypothetical protein
MIRVLPRDAFNDANLLKCIGQIALLSLDRGYDDKFTIEYDGKPFDICQNTDDGSTYVANFRLYRPSDCGLIEIHLYRGLNAREAWPLYADCCDETCEVFNSDGSFHGKFLNMLESSV